ncbi:MAG: hypothetical protein K8R02_09380 [Anaerohalosphaeraceae bacterium]|nr:hypothetical protein [Anaerohalosphaeraceae bacterium]
MIIGIVALLVSVTLLVGLGVWARRIINRMAREKFSSARHAIKELNG